MCPIWPLHLIIIYLVALCPMWVLCQSLPALVATFLPADVTVHMDYSEYVHVNVTGPDLLPGDEMLVSIGNQHFATVEWENGSIVDSQHVDNGQWKGKMRVNGNFLGRTDALLEVRRSGQRMTVTNGTLPVTVLRPVRIIDSIFVGSVATFVALIFINFGCAMDWPTVKECIRRPIGPLIGLAGQFLFMPLMTFGLGFLIFPDSPELRLGMFFTGVAPGGGASNIWTFILGGNLNLSLAMTTISTLASFALMPAWLFSLGQVVFRNARIVVPYARIASFVATLVIPLGIGLAMQRYTPRLSAFMVRILKGFSSTLLLFIIVFAIVTNIYIFELFSWQIVVAGMGVPWLGYLAGYALAKIFRQPHADALAVSIETGIQNTGIAIFLLRYALDQPEADITTVVPVSVAIMTPLPMMTIYIYQKIRGCIRNRNIHKKMLNEDATPVSEALPSVATIDAKSSVTEP